MPAPPSRFESLCLLQAPVELTSSFQRGSAEGAAAVAAELDVLGGFDADVGRTLDPQLERHHAALDRSDLEYPRAIETLERESRRWIERGAFVLTLGGEHTVTLGPLRTATSLWGDVGVVQLDAHGDLRDAYEGESFSHACVMRRAVVDLGLRLVGIGIRSMCTEEADLVSSNPRVRHVRPREILASIRPVADALESLPSLVYLTVDMDVFDPSVAPGVGTPEPGGLGWYQVADIIDLVASQRRIIGADVVELAPAIERPRTVRLAARTALRVLLRSLA